jgi:predicted nucleotidyltransferase
MRRRIFSTNILDATVSRRAERLEAERRSLLEKVSHMLRSEATRLGVAEAYIVGSLTREGEWTDASDVDVAISGGNPLEVMKAVEEAAERTVDVVDLERHPAPGMFRRRGMKVVG